MKPTPAEPSNDPKRRTQSQSELALDALRAGKNKRVRKLLARMHPAKAAALLESLDAEQRLALWQQIAKKGTDLFLSATAGNSIKSIFPLSHALPATARC